MQKITEAGNLILENCKHKFLGVVSHSEIVEFILA